MGQVNQSVYCDGQFIGINTFPNLSLNPGNNTVPFVGTSNQTLVLNLIQTKYKNGILPVTIIGNSSVYNGQHLPYFEASLSSLELQTQLNVGAALAALGLDITGGGSSSSSSSSAGTSQPTSSGQPSSTSSGTQATTTS